MRIKKHSHCNPTTIARLNDILERSGFHVTYIKSSSDYPNQNSNMKFFDRHPITHRNIFGVAHLT